MYARIRYPCFCIETCKYKTHMLDDLFLFVFLNKQYLLLPVSHVSLGIGFVTIGKCVRMGSVKY